MKRSRRRLLLGLASVALPLLRLVPWETGRLLGRLVGEAGFIFARRERALALEHLSLALGDRLSERERRETCRRVFRNTGQGAMEFIMLLDRFGPPLLRMVDGGEFRERLRRHREQGKGVIVLTGHLGNWELAGAWTACLFPASVVARRIYYEPFNRILVRMRARLGMRTIYRNDSPRKILRSLRRNEVVAILADQDVSDVQGVHVDFFGRPAYTPTGPVSLAFHSGAPMLLAFVIRVGARFRIVSYPFDLVRTGNRREELHLNTQRWSTVLEDLIRENPDQWPWNHRRWKTTAAVLERKRRERRAGRPRR